MEEEREKYINTEFGKVPSDWRYCTFKDVLITFSSGATPYRAIAEYYKGKIRWISSGELNYNVIYDTLEHISEAAVKNTNLKTHEPGTFLMAITGLEAEGTRGRCAIIGAPSTTNQSCLALNGTSKMTTDYLFWFYRQYGNYLAFKYCQGTKQQSYTAAIIKKLPICCPKDPNEQTAIATALSDTDALIAALDKKIVKKQQIKQGAMQQLLTGKKRLSGFGEEWVEKAFGEMLTIKHGRDQKLIECVIGKYPILGTGGIIGQTNTPLYSKPSVLIGRKGTIDKPYYYDTPFWTVDTLFFSEIKANFDAKFIYYIFNLIDWYMYNEASGVPSLNAKVIESIRIYVPSTLKEQTGIAEILTDMDQEIAQLEKERDKYVQLKSGLMQVLLTGKVRLIKN